MSHARTFDRVRIAAGLAITVALVLTLAGCGGQKSTTPEAASAKAGLPIAISSLSTMAPDAKLLVVQTTGVASTTSTPVWQYLFGSPKTDKTYMVVVKDGKATETAEYGTAGLSAQEWAKVPGTDFWKIDNADAYKTALASAKASGEAGYTMGFLTYIPAADVGSTTLPRVWYVSFDPATSKATTGTVGVDANTGAVVTK
jgi:hypothetical protein